eukprot:TRINITY_DN57196_c0_g1_i1.p1 TRINITY_DN57196_c0_g1~~TRINITY_DN57196_c0_g1_i1.p1  ORF type:complete len:247 (-),score=32.31 TRINITY_DN57196_c0_g1_i1:27-767(-)
MAIPAAQLSTGICCHQCSTELLAPGGDIEALRDEIVRLGGCPSGKDYCASCWSEWLSSGPCRIVLKLHVEHECQTSHTGTDFSMAFVRALSGEQVATFQASQETTTFGQIRRELYRHLGISQRRWVSDERYCSFEELLQRTPTDSQEDRWEYDSWSACSLCTQLCIILPNDRVVTDAGDIDDDCLLSECLHSPVWVWDTVACVGEGKLISSGSRGQVLEVRGDRFLVKSKGGRSDLIGKVIFQRTD